MTNIVRFAPSPTGRIHIGNARAAVLNWQFAPKNGGQLVSRYDNIVAASAYAQQYCSMPDSCFSE